MKTTSKMIVLVSLMSLGTWMMPIDAQAHRRMHYEMFYYELNPYGTWMDSPEYGYVWVPNVEADFQPYRTSGYWSYTNYGWTWVSNYSWGWAPFHYGRWYFDDWYGWVWIPGNEWAPAWVSWRHCDGYYGWAPLSPGFSISVNIDYNIPWNYWVFIPERHFGCDDQYRYYSDRGNNENLYRRSRVMESTSTDDRQVRYFRGPELREVTRVTGRTIEPMAIRNSERPGQAVRKNSMEVYRPSSEQFDRRGYTRNGNDRIYVSKGDDNRRSLPPVRSENTPNEKRREINSTISKEQMNDVRERVERKIQPRFSNTTSTERNQNFERRNVNDQNRSNDTRKTTDVKSSIRSNFSRETIRSSRGGN